MGCIQVVVNKKDLVTPAQLREISMAAAGATRKGARLLHCQRGQVIRASARARAMVTALDRDIGRTGTGTGIGMGIGMGMGDMANI